MKFQMAMMAALLGLVAAPACSTPASSASAVAQAPSRAKAPLSPLSTRHLRRVMLAYAPRSTAPDAKQRREVAEIVRARLANYGLGGVDVSWVDGRLIVRIDAVDRHRLREVDAAIRTRGGPARVLPTPAGRDWGDRLGAFVAADALAAKLGITTRRGPGGADAYLDVRAKPAARLPPAVAKSACVDRSVSDCAVSARWLLEHWLEKRRGRLALPAGTEWRFGPKRWPPESSEEWIAFPVDPRGALTLEAAEVSLEAARMLGGTIVRLRLDAPSAKAFADFTGRHTEHLVGIAVGDTVVSTPVVRERISGGVLSIRVEARRSEVRRAAHVGLALALEGRALPIALERVDRRLEHPAACTGAEGCEAACARGNVLGCARVADLGGEVGAAKASRALGKACHSGLESACERICATGTAEACTQAAATLVSGPLVARDLPHGMKLYRSACPLGSDDACAKVMDRALAEVMPASVDRARALLTELRGNLTEACGRRPLAVCPPLVRFARRSRSACDADGIPGRAASGVIAICEDVATLFETGSGVARDPAQARIYRGRAEALAEQQRSEAERLNRALQRIRVAPADAGTPAPRRAPAAGPVEDTEPARKVRLSSSTRRW